MATLTVVKPSTLAATQFRLDGVETTIGRAPENKIVVDDRGVSRHHAKVVNTNRGFLLVDDSSRGGTYIGGREVKSELLHEGDLIQVGDTVFRFASRDDSDATMMSHAGELGEQTTLDVPAPEAPEESVPAAPPLPPPRVAAATPLTVRCIACSHDIPTDTVFCPPCGKPQQISQPVIAPPPPPPIAVPPPPPPIAAPPPPPPIAVMASFVSPETLSSSYTNSIVVRRWAGTVVDFLFLAAISFAAWMFQKLLVLWVILLLGYYPLLEAFLGATPGKYAAGIRVVDENGGRPGLWKAILRTLARLIEVNPVLFGCIPAGIIVLTSKKKQRLGDMMAGTFVLTSADSRRVRKA